MQIKLYLFSIQTKKYRTQINNKITNELDADQ